MDKYTNLFNELVELRTIVCDLCDTVNELDIEETVSTPSYPFSVSLDDVAYMVDGWMEEIIKALIQEGKR